MIVEKFASNNISFPSQESIPEPYSSWCKNFLKERSSLQYKSITCSAGQHCRSFPWEIRLPSNEFKSWLREKNSFSFFFDGASKGNPGVAGARGILLDPRGHVEQTFVWGLGNRTNNEAEWLALLQGLHLLSTKKLRKVLIFGDSRHVIFKLINGYPSGAVKCHHLFEKAKLLMSKSHETLHILRHNNSPADILANMGATLPQGHYNQNGNHPILKFIP